MNLSNEKITRNNKHNTRNTMAILALNPSGNNSVGLELSGGGELQLDSNSCGGEGVGGGGGEGGVWFEEVRGAAAHKVNGPRTNFQTYTGSSK